MIFLCYILPHLIIYYWFSSTCYSYIIPRICFFYFSVLLLQLLFLFSSDISVGFSSSVLRKPPVSFTPFSFPSLTLLSLSSPLLHHFFPKLTSLFWLSITKSNAFALLSSSDSSVNSCPSIISSSSCSIFNLLNTFYSF